MRYFDRPYLTDNGKPDYEDSIQGRESVVETKVKNSSRFESGQFCIAATVVGLLSEHVSVRAIFKTSKNLL